MGGKDGDTGQSETLPKVVFWQGRYISPQDMVQVGINQTLKHAAVAKKILNGIRCRCC